MYIDDALVATSADRDFWVPVYDERHQYFCLFGSYAGNLADDTDVASKAICRFYHFKVWDTKDKDNLLCHIVPVYGEAEQAVGLYDLVANRFLPAHGGTLAGHYTLAANGAFQPVDALSGVIDLNGHGLTVTTTAKNTSSSVAGASYQDLEYITTTSSQAIEIPGFRLPGTAKVEMKLRPNANVAGTTEFLFCSRTAGKQDTYSCCMMDSGYLRFDFNNKNTTGNKATLTVGEDYTLVFDGTAVKPTWSVNGTTEKAHDATSNDFTGGSDLILFGNSLAGTINCRLYYFTVTTNGVTALDLRPVRRLADGVAGLYDTVGGAFYTSGTSTALPGLATPKFTNSCETASVLNVGQGLIPGYTVVDRIISSSDAFIKTGYVPAATDRLELKASLSNVSNTYGLFCSRKDQTSEMFNALFTAGGVRFDFNANKSGQKTTSFKPEVDEVFTVALDGNEKACYTNGAVAATFAFNDFTPTATVYLFALHANNGDSSARAPGSIYWFKVRGADGTLKVDMVPAVRNQDNVAGLYDRVRHRFYPSASETDFTAGTQVGDGKLYIDVDGAFAGSEIAGNITLVKKGEKAFDGGGMSLATTLRPEAGTVGGVTMQDGATLDLSALSDVFSLDENAISFADGASITIDLGSRTASSRSPLVSWTVPPANLGTLKFIRAAGATRGFVVKSDGIYLAPKGLIISFF